MALPTGVLYGRVKWTAISAVADSSDPDELPDVVPVSGTVTLTASIASLAVGGSTAPITVFLTPVIYNLDRLGVLRDSQGRPLLTLVATDTVPEVAWKWTATYRLNGGLARGAIDFSLPAGTVVDLTNPGVPITDAEPDDSVATAIDNGNGTFTASGDAIDNGDGTFTSLNLADNGDGTFTIAA